MPLRGFSWFLCCKQGFSLLGVDYEEKEVEESLEMRIKKQETCNGQGLLDVTLSQPTHTVIGPSSLTVVPEEMRNLITEKSNMCPKEDPDVVVKGWLYREVRGGWIQQRRHWFVLSQDSLDYYSSHEKSSRRLGSLVLTSLCSVIWPDKLAYRETGYWNITVYGRKHCYQLYTKHFNEAVHWACAIQKVIDSKAPVETPTQLLIRDIEENRFNPEEVEQIYHHNPILRYTKGPLYASLLPFTYGSLDLSYYSGKGYTTLRDEAVKVFNSLQQLETAQDPVPLIQGVLQTCLDICALRDEVYCQLVKQTIGTPTPETSGHLRYWQLLTCMSCTFLPGMPVLNYLHFHINRVQSQSPPDTEKVRYATFISDALKKTWCRECVPSWEEIRVLMRRQEMQCTVHYPGPGSCQLPISSHTTANELVERLQKLLGLQASRNTFALFEQSAQREQAIGGNTIVADVLTSLSTQEAESGSKGRLCFKLYCFLDIDSISVDSTEHMFLFEQCHEMLVRGQLPASEEDLQALAALRLQSLIGDYSTHSPCPPLDELFPGHVLKARVLLPFRIIQSPLSVTAYSQAPPLGCSQRFPGNLLTGAMWSHTAANKQKAEQDQLFKCRLKEEEALVMGDIVERWKGLAGFNRHNSMTAYLTIVRRWPGFGCTLYEVDFYISSTGSSAQKLWLGVAAKSLSLYKQGEPEALEFFPYIQIRSYGVTDSNKFKVTTGEQDLFFETSKMTEIMQLMNAYFSARQQEKGQETGMETEGGFCHTPAVLELPQHLV